MPEHFQVGDRVRAKGKLDDLPLNATGTVHAVFGLHYIYDVLFDGTTQPRLMQATALELARPRERVVGGDEV